MDDTLHYKAQLPLAAPGGGAGELALSIDNGRILLAFTNERGETAQFQLDKQASLDLHEGLERSMFFLQFIS